MTIINHSFLYDGNDEPISSCIPIVRRLQQANQRKSVTSDDSLEVIVEPCQQIEQILNTYRQELTNDSNSDWNCHEQLIARLVELLRTNHSSNENQIKNLHDDIVRLQNQRQISSSNLSKQWKEIDDETIRLQQLVQIQHEQITKLVELLTERNLIEQFRTGKNDSMHFSPCSSIDS